MRRKGWYKWIAICGAVALALSGCGGAPAGEAPARADEHAPETAAKGKEKGREQSREEEKASYEQSSYEQPSYEQPKMEGELTISSLYEQEFLSIAAERFMERYPQVKISVNVFDGNSDQEYLTYMNTKIMTGKAEDILFTAFLPVEKYCGMGVFEDLSAYVDATAEWSGENYYMNVIRAAQREDGALYLIPYKANFHVVSFSRTLLSDKPQLSEKLQGRHSISFSEAMDLSLQMLEGTARKNAFLIQESEAQYAGRMLKDGKEDYLDEARRLVNLDTPQYIALLEQIRDLSERGYFNSGDIDFYNMEYYFAADLDFGVQGCYYSLDQNSDRVYGMALSDAQGHVSTDANSCIAINSASGQKGLAWEFIRYLLSEEIQTLPCIYGPAVNRKGFEAAAERYYRLYEDGDQGGVSWEDYRKLLADCMEQIDSCDTSGSDVDMLIFEENEKFFRGQQTAEEAAGVLQKHLEQHFYE